MAVPGTAAGLDQLHRRYGVVDWGVLVLQAEGLARRGTPISRSLAAAAQAEAPMLRTDPVMAERFLDGNGQGVAQDGVITQVELATVLAQIRIRGAGDFYSGQSAATFLDGVADAGGALSQSDLRSYAAVWSDTLFLDMAGMRVYVALGAPGGGVVAGQLWAMLAADPRFTSGDEATRAHLFAEASARAYGDRGNAAANSFAVFPGPDPDVRRHPCPPHAVLGRRRRAKSHRRRCRGHRVRGDGRRGLGGGVYPDHG